MSITKSFSFLFRGLNWTSTEEVSKSLEKLNERIVKQVEDAKHNAHHPFEQLSTKEDIWVMKKEAIEFHLNFPSDGYNSEEQASIALALWKANNHLDYGKLYYTSKLIVQGIK